MTVTPAVIQPSTSTGDAIPLMVSSTSGRNNSQSYRDGLVNLMALPATTSGELYPRQGVLGRVQSAVTGANGVNSFYVHRPAVPSGLQFVVEPGSAVVASSGSSGGYLVNSKTALTLTLDAANASNPRIDRVYLQVSDILASASSTLLQVGVVTGTPAGTPTTPPLPTITTGTQYMDLGTILVPAAASNLTSATFFDTRTGTSVNGVPRPVLGNDVLSAAGSAPGERRVRQHATYGTLVDQYGYDGVWHGTMAEFPIVGTWQASGSATITFGTTEVALYSISIPDPGFPYYLKGYIGVEWNSTTANGGSAAIAVHDTTLAGTGYLGTAGYVSAPGAYDEIDRTGWLKTAPGSGNPVPVVWSGAKTFVLGAVVLGSGNVVALNPNTFGSAEFTLGVVPA